MAHEQRELLIDRALDCREVATGLRACLDEELAPDLLLEQERLHVGRDAIVDRAVRVRDYGRVDLRLTESGEIYVLDMGEPVLIVDLDPQGNASTGLGIPQALRERSS